jgi:hypothetical protein
VSAEPLPIVCAWCERVRTASGRWEDTGSADGEPQEATHGICPECFAEETRAASVAPRVVAGCP